MSLFWSFANSAIVQRLQSTSQTLFTRYLLFTNTTISVTLSVGGDIIMQNVDKARGKKKHFDPIRARNFGAAGATVGVTCHYWYIWLDSYLPGRTIRRVMQKVVVDQVAFSPFMWAVFFGTYCSLEGKTVRQTLHEFRDLGIQLWLAEWYVWPPAQMINFYYLPLKYRVLFDNAVSLVFDVFTSHIKYKNQPLDVDTVEEVRPIEAANDDIDGLSSADAEQKANSGRTEPSLVSEPVTKYVVAVAMAGDVERKKLTWPIKFRS